MTYAFVTRDGNRNDLVTLKQQLRLLLSLKHLVPFQIGRSVWESLSKDVLSHSRSASARVKEGRESTAGELMPVRAVLAQETMKMDEGPDKETEWRDEQKQLHFPRLRRHQRVQGLTEDNYEILTAQRQQVVAHSLPLGVSWTLSQLFSPTVRKETKTYNSPSLR